MLHQKNSEHYNKLMKSYKIASDSFEQSGNMRRMRWPSPHQTEPSLPPTERIFTSMAIQQKTFLETTMPSSFLRKIAYWLKRCTTIFYKAQQSSNQYKHIFAVLMALK